MAKKKNGRKKAATKVDDKALAHSPFWAYSAAVVLMLLALFVLLGGFNAGGVLPVNLFHGSYWLVGWAAYALPIALVYAGVYKFKTEDHRIPLDKLISIVLA